MSKQGIINYIEWQAYFNTQTWSKRKLSYDQLNTTAYYSDDWEQLKIIECKSDVSFNTSPAASGQHDSFTGLDNFWAWKKTMSIFPISMSKYHAILRVARFVDVAINYRHSCRHWHVLPKRHIKYHAAYFGPYWWSLEHLTFQNFRVIEGAPQDLSNTIR